MKGKNKNISNSCKRKSLALSQPQLQPQLQAVHSNCNLKQPLRQALNSENVQGGETYVDIFKELEDAEPIEQGKIEKGWEIPPDEFLEGIDFPDSDVFCAHLSTLPGSITKL